jgi:HTH-type transcriptional regulator/antitoxin HigA
MIVSAEPIDERKYRQLLGRTLPSIIKMDAEYNRALAMVKGLIEKDDLTPEEGRLLELLSVLVEEYEDRVHPLPKGSPNKMLEVLIEEKGLKPRDLWKILPKSRVSEILHGKRSISKEQAKKLAEFFKVPVELFL